MTDFDDVIDDLGLCGRFQIVLVILVALFGVVPGMCLYFPRFSEAMPTWSCHPVNDTVKNEVISNSTSPYTTSNLTEDLTSTGMINDTVDKCNPDGTFCDGTVFESSYTSVRTEWNFCQEDFLFSGVSIIPIVGMLLGGFIFGQLIDTFGRKPVLFLAYFGCIAAQAAISFIYIWHLYIACKFLIGFCISGVFLASFLLPMEVVGKKYRMFVGVPFFWLGGSMLLSLLALFLPNWRHLSITIAALGVPVLFTWWLIPESPRWLIQKGRTKQADTIIQKIADWNHKDFPEFDKVKNISNEKHCIFKYSYCDLFRGKSMIRDILIMCYIWFICSMLYHGNLEKIGNISDNIYLNFFLLQSSELPAFVLVIFTNERTGRTKTLSSMMMTSGLACLVILLAETLGQLANTEWHVKVFALISKGSIAGAWILARIMAAETFPTLVRGIGIGASSMAAECGRLSVPLVLSLYKRSRPLPVIVFGCLTLLGAVISLFLPETMSRAMPDHLPQRDWCGSGQHSETTPKLRHSSQMRKTNQRNDVEKKMSALLLADSGTTEPANDQTYLSKESHENGNGWYIGDGTAC